MAGTIRKIIAIFELNEKCIWKKIIGCLILLELYHNNMTGCPPLLHFEPYYPKKCLLSQLGNTILDHFVTFVAAVVDSSARKFLVKSSSMSSSSQFSYIFLRRMEEVILM